MEYRHLSIRKAALALVAGTAFIFFSCQSGPVRIDDHRLEAPLEHDLYKAAKADLQAGRYENALTSLMNILDVNPDHPDIEEIKYNIALAYYYMGDFENSINVSDKWLVDYPESRIKGEVLTLLGKSCQARGDYSGAFSWFLRQRESAIQSGQAESRVEQIDPFVIELINSSRMPDLLEMQKKDDKGIYAPHIHKKAALLYLEENQLQKARKSAMALVRSTSEQSMVNAGRELLETIYRRIGETYNVKRNAIGCLLPLTGPFALYGQELLNGIQLGMDIFNRSAADKIELIIINTSGNVEDSVAGVETLVQQEKVIAILGPLSAKPALAAVKKAQELGVPIITFAQREDITGEGDMVFRNFLTPAKEVKTLLNRSMNNMGMKRFGIFYPDTPYGRHLMNLFWDGVDEMGGSITAVEAYNPDETDFTEGIKKMVGLYYSRPESVSRMLKAIKEMEKKQTKIESPDSLDPEIEGTGEEVIGTDPNADILSDATEPETDRQAEDDVIEEDEEPEPIVDFDAVFIPDDHRNIALIASQYPFNNVFNVPFLGTSLWLSNDLIETTGDYIQGAIFPAGFYIDSESENIKAFVSEYRENFESDPGIMAANGYDTMRLIMEILKDLNIRTREDFQEALLKDMNFTGVTGKISFDETGEVEKDPLLLTVYGRRLHILR